MNLPSKWLEQKVAEACGNYRYLPLAVSRVPPRLADANADISYGTYLCQYVS
jgi:hypothetical protein